MRPYRQSYPQGHSGFNPRICKRCDAVGFPLQSLTHVSIHASVKDATNLETWAYMVYWVSIHASVKDATLLQLRYRRDGLVSIHASVKDATFGGWVSDVLSVSIHASVKDATRYIFVDKIM